MAIGDDFSVAVNGDIRHTSGTTVYSDLDLHEWLQDLADDGSITTSGDNVSILTGNPSKLDGPRSAIKPMLLNLLGTYNIDDTAAQFFNFGSVQQDGTDELYTGVKTIGSPLVAGSPMYIVQNGAKLTSYWPDGHVQIMVKAKTGGTLIDSGDIRVFSRKYGQDYGDFAANLVAGGEQPAAISTSTTSWTPLDLVTSLALSSDVVIAVGEVTEDTGDGSGSKVYKGTITLSNGITVAEAAQYCQAICDQASVVTIDGSLGWKYRVLGAFGYTPNGKAPFGAVAGGKWFVSQGWFIEGALPGDLQNYQMVSHDGTTVGNPVVAGISIGGVTIGSRIIVGRDAATISGFDDTEYSLSAPTTSGGNTCVVVEAINTDTPDTGFIRINAIPYAYTALDRVTKTFTISGTFGQIHASSSPAWCPFIDKIAVGTTESSSSYTFDADFTARLKVRKGTSGSSLQPFETTFAATSSATNGTNAIATPDE
ncbi:MAG: hypothetical protein COB36_10655 [Alphaproteobacteria bacterium]|nr:MAG: hypothetical protein COB36_10655 [Alphaproteobacteria bacterium]